MRSLRLFQPNQCLFQRRAGGFAPELQLRRIAAATAFHLPGDH
jgi:hypothetical protein